MPAHGRKLSTISHESEAWLGQAQPLHFTDDRDDRQNVVAGLAPARRIHCQWRSFVMTTIFISHAKEDAVCAEQISQGLEAQGYSVRRESTSLSLESILYPRTIENFILGSAAVLLLWSSSAAQS